MSAELIRYIIGSTGRSPDLPSIARARIRRRYSEPSMVSLRRAEACWSLMTWKAKESSRQARWRRQGVGDPAERQRVWVDERVLVRRQVVHHGPLEAGAALTREKYLGRSTGCGADLQLVVRLKVLVCEGHRYLDAAVASAWTCRK